MKYAMKGERPIPREASLKRVAGSSEDDLETRCGTIAGARRRAGVSGGSDPVGFRPVDRRETYAFVRRVLVRFRHADLPKAGKAW